MSLTIEMHDPLGRIFEELRYPRITQASIAITYAFIIAQEPNADFGPINDAICKRWSGMTSLNRIKAMAWKHVEHWQQNGVAEDGGTK